MPVVPTNRLRLMIVLGGFCAIGPFAVDTYLPALPELGDDLGASASHVQLTITTFLLGLAIGQIFAGPLSDRFGRRLPLILGMLGFGLASLLCAFAPGTDALIALRLLQGIAGGFGLVIARAIVRDVYSDVAAAQFFSALMLAFGVGPVLAPVIGGGILTFTDWRGIFVFLALLGALLALIGLLALTETLAPERRHAGGFKLAVGSLRSLLGDRELLSFAGPAALAHGGMMAYIAASSYIFQDKFDVSPQLFALIFGVTSAGMIAISRVGRRLVARVGAAALLRAGLILNLTAAAALLAVVLADLGVLGVAIPCFVLVSSLGLITPNALALGLDRHPERAGGASGVFGLLQYTTGATAAPLVGVAGASALPLAIVVATLSSAAFVVRHLLATPRPAVAP